MKLCKSRACRVKRAKYRITIACVFLSNILVLYLTAIWFMNIGFENRYKKKQNKMLQWTFYKSLCLYHLVFKCVFFDKQYWIEKLMLLSFSWPNFSFLPTNKLFIVEESVNCFKTIALETSFATLDLIQTKRIVDMSTFFINQS